MRNKEQKRFAERYFLKHDEPLIRIRVLDESLVSFNAIMDISIRLSDFEKKDWACSKVLIAENKMNFLTLPPLTSAIAIWSGGGFNVSYLKNARWLKNKKIFYWGDIDEHGFQMLHQVRSYYPQTQSIMMDKQTFELFGQYVVNGERNRTDNFDLLNKEETNFYSSLKLMKSGNRLEQEKIPQTYVDVELKKLL